MRRLVPFLMLSLCLIGCDGEPIDTADTGIDTDTDLPDPGDPVVVVEGAVVASGDPLDAESGVEAAVRADVDGDVSEERVHALG